MLIYKFKKERLYGGNIVSRPRILVSISGKTNSIEVPSLLDSGCDITVIPESLAMAIGLDMDGEKSKLFAYRESTDTIRSKMDITFVGRAGRESQTIKDVPILIALSKGDIGDETDIVLGVEKIFDEFDILFRKTQNKIIMKRVNRN